MAVTLCGRWMPLEAQGYACAMCRKPFEDDQPISIDHDHNCCPAEKSSCGRCVRGLLDLSCNASLGHIERKYEMAQSYLDSPLPCGLCGSRPPPDSDRLPVVPGD